MKKTKASVVYYESFCLKVSWDLNPEMYIETAALWGTGIRRNLHYGKQEYILKIVEL